MSAALVTILAAAAESCPELDTWRRCEVNRGARCGMCKLGGPDRCEAQVIKALARRVAALTERTA